MSSKVSTSSDVSDVIETFYDSHKVSESAIVKIDSVMQSAGVYKIGKEGAESYIIKMIKSKISSEDSSRILNASINLITKIVYREDLQKKMASVTHAGRKVELQNEIEFLNDEICNRISWQNLLIAQYRELACKENISF